ncbi:hypothetical protein FH602_08845 [Leptospira kirschneri]|nr:hypothetical protein [Leptospira kirschneri]UML81681.1 hypothetical protein FH602_08845 [Leptospira kirschneri]
MRTFLSGLFWSRFQPIWSTRLVGQGEIRSYDIGKEFFLLKELHSQVPNPIHLHFKIRVVEK